MKKTKFTKSLAFKTILRIFVIAVVISLIASVFIGAISFAVQYVEMCEITGFAAYEGIVDVSYNITISKSEIDNYFKTGEPDEKYIKLHEDLIEIAKTDFELERCDIFVPHEDSYTYLTSTEDDKAGQSLGKEEPYFGEEKVYVSKAMSVSLKEDNDLNQLLTEEYLDKTLYTGNKKDGKKLMTSYMPVVDENGTPIAVFAASQSYDKVIIRILRNILGLFIVTLIIMVIIAIIFFISIRKRVITPVTDLTKSVRTMKESIESRQAVTTNIRTGDEIEELAVAFEDMNKDLISYIDENTKITAEKERLDTELNLATNIQAGMLPDKFPAFPDRKDFDIYASMDPAKEVGGDFYDFFLIDENTLGLIMADVSGKGIPAALFMMHSKILLKSYSMVSKSPKEVLEEVNNQICEHNPEDMFVTVWLGVLDLKTGKLTAANAGHEKPALKLPDGSFELYQDKHGIAVGSMEGLRYREYEMTLAKGAKLFLYTDGVPEATSVEEELFGTNRMIEALRTAENSAPKEILAAVDAAVNEFVGDAPQFDDLTMMCIEYKGEPED